MVGGGGGGGGVGEVQLKKRKKNEKQFKNIVENKNSSISSDNYKVNTLICVVFRSKSSFQTCGRKWGGYL